jgi:hypothetical protein
MHFLPPEIMFLPPEMHFWWQEMHFWWQGNYFLPPEMQYGLGGCRFPQICRMNAICAARSVFLATRNNAIATGN